MTIIKQLLNEVAGRICSQNDLKILVAVVPSILFPILFLQSSMKLLCEIKGNGRFISFNL